MNKPLLLRPSGKDYLWGGQRLNTEFEKGIEMSPLAETWECSTHPDGPCFVAEGEFAGQTLGQVLSGNPAYLGSRHMGCTELPLLLCVFCSIFREVVALRIKRSSLDASWIPPGAR